MSIDRFIARLVTPVAAVLFAGVTFYAFVPYLI